MRGVLAALVALLAVPAFAGVASAGPLDPPNMMQFECGGEFQTGNCRVECNGDFPCCYYYYVAGIEMFYWCAV